MFEDTQIWVASIVTHIHKNEFIGMVNQSHQHNTEVILVIEVETATVWGCW